MFCLVSRNNEYGQLLQRYYVTIIFFKKAMWVKILLLLLCVFVFTACTRSSSGSKGDRVEPTTSSVKAPPSTVLHPRVASPVAEHSPTESASKAKTGSKDSAQENKSPKEEVSKPSLTVNPFDEQKTLSDPPLSPGVPIGSSVEPPGPLTPPQPLIPEELVPPPGPLTPPQPLIPAESVLSPGPLTPPQPLTPPKSLAKNRFGSLDQGELKDLFNKKAKGVSPCRGRVQDLMSNPNCVVPKWLKEATVRDETVLITLKGEVIWEDGVWGFGSWHGDRWKQGLWRGGTFYKGIWEDGVWQSGDWRGYIWHTGLWERGEFNVGIWKGGVFKSGTFRRGIWRAGTWEHGGMHFSIWQDGLFKDGAVTRIVWRTGYWQNGRLTDSLWKYGYWMNGNFMSGVWENGIFYDGEFEDAIWMNGIFKGRLFYFTSSEHWQCGIFEDTAKWGHGWGAKWDRVNRLDCDLSLAGVPPAFLTEEQTYTFIEGENIYRCADCSKGIKKIHHLKAGCRGSIKYVSQQPSCLVPKWLQKAKTLDEKVAITLEGEVIWEDGVWLDGHWKGGIWQNGMFANGIWEDGIWENGLWGDNILKGYGGGGGLWITGVWKNGLFKEGLWIDGWWKDGYHTGGDWFGGIWDGGRWYNGTWLRGPKGPEVTGQWAWVDRLFGVDKRTLSQALLFYKNEEYFSTRPHIKKRYDELIKTAKALEEGKSTQLEQINKHTIKSKYF